MRLEIISDTMFYLGRQLDSICLDILFLNSVYSSSWLTRDVVVGCKQQYQELSSANGAEIFTNTEMGQLTRNHDHLHANKSEMPDVFFSR